MSSATARASSPLLSDAPLGEVSRNADRTLEVVFRRHYNAPIEKVWAALTIPERLADWFAVAEVDLRVGGALRLDWGGGNVAEMQITVCEPPRALAWVWRLRDRDTLVRFDLTPEAGGCALVLTHSGVPVVGGQGVRAGWHAHLEGLPEAIEGRATPWSTKEAREAALAPDYPPLAP